MIYVVIKPDYALQRCPKSPRNAYSTNPCSTNQPKNLPKQLRIQYTLQIITSAMPLYVTGESLRNVQKFLKL
jgi:hypothetical protein